MFKINRALWIFCVHMIIAKLIFSLNYMYGYLIFIFHFELCINMTYMHDIMQNNHNIKLREIRGASELAWAHVRASFKWHWGDITRDSIISDNPFNSKDYGLTSHYWNTETWIICSTLMDRRYWEHVVMRSYLWRINSRKITKE